MNLSGDAFSKIKNFYKIEDKDFIIVYDDIDLDFSTVRYKEKGSAGTHNGMRSILQHADSQEVPRLRLGINNPIRQHKELSDFVLSNFSKDELQNLSKIFQEGLSKIDI
jgi:PTH1 family peptidyl-tRNA hydrolase